MGAAFPHGRVKWAAELIFSLHEFHFLHSNKMKLFSPAKRQATNDLTFLMATIAVSSGHCDYSAQVPETPSYNIHAISIYTTFPPLCLFQFSWWT